jgi:nucleotide-binding universal stress UspA family protein
VYDSILIPYDGTDEGWKGVEHGIDLAASVGATVHALYVIDLPGTPRTVYVREDEEEMRERYREYGEEVTTEVREAASKKGVDTETALKSGSVREEIVDYADVNDIDLIVIGTAYRGKVGAVLGGTAEKVVRTSRVPVTTIRQLEDEI